MWLKWICTFRTSCCKIKPGIWTLNPELCGSMLETIYSDRCQNLNSHFLTISSLKEEIYCSKKSGSLTLSISQKKCWKTVFYVRYVLLCSVNPFKLSSFLEYEGVIQTSLLPSTAGWYEWESYYTLYTPPIRFLDTCIQFLTVFFMILFFRCFTLRLG